MLGFQKQKRKGGQGCKIVKVQTRSNTTCSGIDIGQETTPEVRCHKRKCLCFLPCTNLSNFGLSAFNLRLFKLTEKLHKAVFLLCLLKK